MVSRRYLRVDIDLDPEPEHFRIPAFVQRQYEFPDLVAMLNNDIAMFRVESGGIPSRQIRPGDLLFVDFSRKLPGFGQPAVFADGTLDIFGCVGEVQGAVVGLFRRLERQV